MPKGRETMLFGLLAILLSIAAAAAGNGLRAQTAAEGSVKKISDLPDYEFTIAGKLFMGYEFLDYQDSSKNGGDILDDSGPTEQDSGFRVDRAYITLKGEASDGPFRDWNFRITTDLAAAAEQGDGCDADSESRCEEDNDYNVVVKYAYLSMPISFLNSLWGKSSLRIGQQHLPTVDGQAGVSLQKYWGHRYIAKTTWDELKLSSSTDRGAALIHRHEYYGLHLLLGNGEGYHHSNAEGIDDGDSHALTLYGMASIIPTGKYRGLHFSLNLPFRFDNLLFLNSQEAREQRDRDRASAQPDAAGFIEYREPDLGRKREYSYGAELDSRLLLGSWRFTTGVGYALKTIPEAVDKIHSESADGQIETTLETLEEEQGSSLYGFAHFRWKYLGAFFRITTGTADSKGDGQLETVRDDQEEGEFTRRQYGVTLFPSAQASFFQASLGVDEVSANRAGETKGELGNSSSNRQTFIRMQLVY